MRCATCGIDKQKVVKMLSKRREEIEKTKAECARLTRLIRVCNRYIDLVIQPEFK